MVAFVVATLLAGVGTGLTLNELLDETSTGFGYGGGFVAGQLLSSGFGLLSWAYTGLFIAWLYNAGRFADLQPLAGRSVARTLGAFSPLIPDPELLVAVRSDPRLLPARRASGTGAALVDLPARASRTGGFAVAGAVSPRPSA